VWIFFIFWPSKICVISTDIISSLSPPQCRLSSGCRHHAAMLCHASFTWNQDELAASASSSGNASTHRLSSRAETEALNPHHRCLLPSADNLTPTFTSIKGHLNIDHSPHHFASSLARTSRHWSSICRRYSLSPPSHAHRPSAQWHPWWQTSWLSFAFRTANRHINLYKKIF
jgi:hypothetical protein